MALSNLTKVQTVGIGSNIEVVGVITTGQFKSGTSNLHSTGVELTNLNVSGIATIGGNLSIGGTLTYQDVTNIDSVGLITARAGVNVSGGQLDVGSNIKIGNAGVITATSFVGSGVNLTNVNANTLDSIDSLSFLRSDANDVASGTITFSSTGSTYGPIITSNSDAGPKLSINATGTGGKHWMWISNGSSNTDGAGYLQAWNNTDSFSPVTFGAASNITTKFRTGLEISGKVLINTTAVTNTNDQLTVKRPASSFGEMSMTVDANTTTGTHANAFIFTKSKNTYWNGLGFQSSHGHIGAIVGMRDSTGMNASHKMRIEIGGTAINASEEKTWDFLNTGDLSISDGNLVVASGHGISFSADGNSSGMTSELLDDYEEGSFTVSVKSVNGGAMNGSYSQQSGRYTKIGRMVHIRFDMTWSGWTNASGAIQIDNLPFTNFGVSSSGGYGAPQFRDCSGLHNDIKLYGNSSWFESNSNRIRVMAWNSSGTEYYITPNQSGRVTGEGVMYTEV